ncbi:MAG: response regulator, partial [bacterium]|nr:response regulator [bacterium]
FALGHNKGISFWDGSALRVLNLDGKIKGNFQLCRVMDLVVDAKKNIWAALDGAGLVKIDHRLKVTWYGKPHGLSNKVSSIWIDKPGNFWAGTGDGLYRMTRDSFTRVPITRYPVPRIRNLYMAGDTSLYVTCRTHGLYIYNIKEKQWKNFQVPGNSDVNSSYTVIKDRRGRLLVGTRAGLFQLDRENNTLVRFSRDGLDIRRPVYFILEAPGDRLWFGTNHGVIRWDRGQVRNYTISQGLAGQETNRAAAIIDSAGRTWIGTDHGVSVYNEDFESPMDWERPPKLQLLSLTADNNQLPISNPEPPVRLKYDTHSMVFHFRTIDFKDETAITYDYKLEGFDEQWVTGARPYKRRVRYSNLTPGAYRFHIRAQNLMGVWSEEVRSPEIIIVTPFYSSWWFYLLLALSAVLMLYGVFRFVTNRRYAALLETQVEERTRQLKAVEQQLLQAQKMEAIGTLAGGIAHDFNNILGVIMGYSELVLEDLEPGSLAYQNADQVLTASHRASGLVKQILAFSRQTKRERKPLDAVLMVNESIKLLRSILPATIDIRRRIGVDSAVVVADTTQIHQIIMNLCTNSAHAMRETGGVLEVGLDEIQLDSQAVKKFNDIPPGPYLRLTVSDTGHGIPKIVLKRIFEPYFTTKGAGEGTGMGLAMIHGIVKSYDGDISVYSEPGKGTTFHVVLPRIQEADTIETRPRGNAGLPRGNERVLLIDDETTLVKVGTQVLERLGYRVTGKSDPQEALDTFRDAPHQFDLVVTDLTMPNITGIQIAKIVKKIKPGIPVILCSGFSASIPQQEIDSNVGHFVMKPIIKSELARAIREVVEEKRSS